MSKLDPSPFVPPFVTHQWAGGTVSVRDGRSHTIADIYGQPRLSEDEACIIVRAEDALRIAQFLCDALNEGVKE